MINFRTIVAICVLLIITGLFSFQAGLSTSNQKSLTETTTQTYVMMGPTLTRNETITQIATITIGTQSSYDRVLVLKNTTIVDTNVQTFVFSLNTTGYITIQILNSTTPVQTSVMWGASGYVYQYLTTIDQNTGQNFPFLYSGGISYVMIVFGGVQQSTLLDATVLIVFHY